MNGGTRSGAGSDAGAVLAVLLALGGACALGTAAVLQQDAAFHAPRASGPGSGLRLVAGLLRRRRWLAGQATGALGLGLVAVALHLGVVVVVQPLLASQLVFSLLLSGVLAHRRTGRSGLDVRLWSAAGLVVGGLLLFTACARPTVAGVPAGSPGAERPSDDAWVVGAAVAALLLHLVATLVGPRLPARRRSLLFALAAALGFGTDAVLIAAAGDRLAAGEVLSPPLVSLAVLAPCSVVAAQQAFHSGAVTTALPTVAAVEPVVAILLAGPVLGESLATGLGWRAGQGTGLVLLLTGVVVLARRQPPTGGPAGPLTGAAGAPAAAGRPHR